LEETAIKQLLRDVQDNHISIDEALKILRKLPFEDLDFARIDSHRNIRNGFPEVVLCEGKKIDHIVSIMERLTSGLSPVLATRATLEQYTAVLNRVPEVHYNELARTITFEPAPIVKRPGTILVLTGGTADIPVAEEAAVTADIMGNHVERLYDVGVAGLHRLLSDIDRIQSASVLIVVAGMEGALPSVVGGLVNRPVIAVPTSIGYGASMNGLAALLAMLNSCAAGVTVVNIDNGFGAGYAASQINALKESKDAR
jgi:NCAIR mutase (PurE)-related protein